MAKFIVRANCEYSIVVEAVDENTALVQAKDTDYSDWEQAWAEDEVEKMKEEKDALL